MFKKIGISTRRFNAALLCGLLCAAFISLADFNVACEDLRANVLRLHIIANSNTDSDQELKLKIRDRILAESDGMFEGVTDVSEALQRAESNTDYYCDLANEVIAENGFSYKAKASVGKCYFETREYDTFTLPAGYYESLIISVGEAKGKNWWCVIFPEVCIPAAAADLSETVTEKTSTVAKSPERYIMRFKAVEIYEKIKKIIIK